MASEEEQAVKPEVVGGLLRLAGRRVAPPEERARRVQAAVHAQWRGTVRARRLRRTALWSSLAAAAACAAWLATFPPRPVREGGSPAAAASRAGLARVEKLSGDVRAAAVATRLLLDGDEIAAGTVLETGGGGRAALRLQGGGSLRVDTGSRLRFISAAEVFLEEGAVYIDSDHDRRSAAVTVQTRLGRVLERGTQFEVRLAAGTMRVRVREGRVALDHGGATEQGSRGEELRLRDGRLVRAAVATHGPEWAWVQQIAPAFEIEGEPLGRFARWVSRETGRPVRLAAGDAPIRLHGSVAGLTPEEALGVVLPTCGRTHWYSRGEIVVGRAAGRPRESGRVP